MGSPTRPFSKSSYIPTLASSDLAMAINWRFGSFRQYEGDQIALPKAGRKTEKD